MILEGVLRNRHDWSTYEGTRLVNVHSRVVAAAPQVCGALLEGLPGPHSIWPSGWPPMVLDKGLQVGSIGGHGPIRYAVSEHDPGRLVRFTTTPDAPFSGWHSFELTPTDRGVRWTHTLVIEQASPRIRLLIVPLHDQILEELLDNAEARAASRPHPVVLYPAGIRFRRAIIRGRGRIRSP